MPFECYEELSIYETEVLTGSCGNYETKAVNENILQFLKH